MQHPKHPSLSPSRRDLEDAWRNRLEMARERYETASARCRKLLEAMPEGLIPRQDDPAGLARCAESEALGEYARILKLFTELTVYGLIPEEKLARKTGVTTGSLISVVDDDESIRDSTRTLLRSAGYEVATFESGEIFLESGALRKTRCLILDVRMPGMTGLELQRRVNLSDARVPVIFVTAHDDKVNRKIAIDAGATEVFQKPFSAHAFLTAVDTALKK